MRAKNLDDNAIRAIVAVLDGWTDHLTWTALIDAIERKTGQRYTRQALHRHSRIQIAFETRKKAVSSSELNRDEQNTSPEFLVAMERIKRLEAENSRLRAENNELLEQYARWAYNAFTAGVDERVLNRPLPSVDRELSKLTKR